ncbi:MAG: hypothetical protein JST81_00145 [Bacteroidetes bacterium]|nr:hypothetical protein [Bacteroidota bacterium]
MKTKQNIRLFCLLGLFMGLMPVSVFAQNLVGVWTGKIYTTEKTLPYEVVISEQDGKLSGFSYTTFMVKGEQMVAMKSIVVKKEKDNIIMEDVDLVFNSFDEESPKQLKQTNTLQLEIVNEKTMLLIGKFKTLKTDKFRSMTGGIRLRKDSIIEEPKLIAKLEEMDLTKSVSFLAPPTAPQEEPATAIAKETPPAEADVAMLGKVETEVNINDKTKKQSNAPAVAAAPTVSRPKLKPVPIVTKSNPAAPVAVAKPSVTAPVTTPATATTVPAPAKKTETRVASKPLATTYGDRTLENIQTVMYKSDSLTLTLYDNGEVDGDTVSVIVNGKMVLAHQGLSTKAITKTIYMTEMADSVQLIMYAESLGSIPPNTGLLIVKDGRDRYEIRFAGDLKKNAAVILRRRPTE